MLWEECCNESSISVKVYQSDKMAHSTQLTVSSASVHISEVMMMKWYSITVFANEGLWMKLCK